MWIPTFYPGDLVEKDLHVFNRMIATPAFPHIADDPPRGQVSSYAAKVPGPATWKATSCNARLQAAKSIASQWRTPYCLDRPGDGIHRIVGTQVEGR